ncbi:hypothetical protein GLAREA_04602 [Glarea lozoyensis ATCC 20868]|uniref:Uncharacterized protein n=1 Tax=Glarea lozoyensis (strain ATCC 20868 / MF5171) TaxID=1116229 RepID=S3D740_GLAL2|nr:uncharacterized protein GLAREA_04602 [Glarea lozoyensis ATCC 20868]EPE27811.1 hypothetical protein GLAREA_04602 [Glarea lozoyensis ATCC 20868]
MSKPERHVDASEAKKAASLFLGRGFHGCPASVNFYFTSWGTILKLPRTSKPISDNRPFTHKSTQVFFEDTESGRTVPSFSCHEDLISSFRQPMGPWLGFASAAAQAVTPLKVPFGKEDLDPDREGPCFPQPPCSSTRLCTD